MRVGSEVTLTVPKVLAEAGVLGFLLFQSAVGWGEFLTPERALWTAGGLLMVGFYGGRIWKDFLSSKTKMASDNDRIRRLEEIVVADRQERTERRGKIDLALERLKMQCEYLDAGVRRNESRERKIMRQITIIATRVDPWVKEFEPDGARSLTQTIAQVDEEPPTEDGRQRQG
jgi:hypothetical protein